MRWVHPSGFGTLLGRRVVINGLVATPDLNGCTGTAVGFHDDKGTYTTVCCVALSSLFTHVHNTTNKCGSD